MIANFGFDTAENEPFEVCRCIHAPPTHGHKTRSVYAPLAEGEPERLDRRGERNGLVVELKHGEVLADILPQLLVLGFISELHESDIHVRV